MAQEFIVKYATVIDALDRKRTRWIVFEDGHPGVPMATKEQAIKQAHAIAEMRVVNGRIAPVKVID